MISQKLYFSDSRIKTQDSKFVPHLFASAGYRFFITDQVSALPSVMTKYIRPLPVQFDVNMKLQYLDLFWLGASYRSGDSFAGMFGLNVSNTFNIGYSYDYSISKLNNVSKGTHEIIVGFLLGNKYGDWCPRNIW
jgi:type IX secretion system PorP/SprF family membrane protein